MRGSGAQVLDEINSSAWRGRTAGNGNNDKTIGQVILVPKAAFGNQELEVSSFTSGSTVNIGDLQSK